MKKGSFYIIISNGGQPKAEPRAGWIYTTSRNTYGLDNRGDKTRPHWIITDLLTGYQCGGHYATRNAALDFITRVDDFISERHNAPEAATARAIIAAAYKEQTPKAEQPPALKYIIEVYETNGTPRASFRRAAATAPELDIPAAYIDDYKREIRKNNKPGKVVFEETAPARLAYLITGQEETKADNTITAPAEAPTEAQRAREEAILNDYIIEGRDPAKIKKLLDKTSNNAERFWDEVRNIAGNLSDHAQARYMVLAEALYKARFTAPQETPTSPATDEGKESTTDAPTTPHSATEDAEKLYKYGMRTRGYSIGAQPTGVVSREDDPSGNYYDIISYKEPLTAADIDHYSLDALTPQEAPAADEAIQTPAEAAEDPQRATESATTGTDEETPAPANGDPAQIITTETTTGTETTPTIDAENATRTDASPAPDETPTNDSKRTENATSARTAATERPNAATTHGTPRGDPHNGRPTADHQHTTTAARRAPPFFKKPIIPAPPHRKNDFEKPISVFGQISGQVIDRPYNPREAGGIKNLMHLSRHEKTTLKIAYSYLVGKHGKM